MGSSSAHTFLFAALADFTALAKAHGDDDAADLVADFLSAVRELIGGRHGFPVIRVGVHSGPATQRDRDWFGATINLAARISAIAGCDEVLLSDATRTQAGMLDGIVLRERGRRSLRNVAEPVVLFEVVRETELPTSGLPVDPVCRMAVDPDNAAGSLRHDGATYYFCSLPCVLSFAERTDRYTSNAATRHGDLRPVTPFRAAIPARDCRKRALKQGSSPDQTHDRESPRSDTGPKRPSNPRGAGLRLPRQRYACDRVKGGAGPGLWRE